VRSSSSTDPAGKSIAELSTVTSRAACETAILQPPLDGRNHAEIAAAYCPD
jgi:hypothetical protein